MMDLTILLDNALVILFSVILGRCHFLAYGWIWQSLMLEPFIWHSPRLGCNSSGHESLQRYHMGPGPPLEPFDQLY